jgi:hypothetical protein
VVDIRPIVRQKEGTRFPDDFVSSMKLLIPQLEFERKETLQFRVSMTESAQKQLRDSGFFRDRPALDAFANQFGFQRCDIESSLAGDPDIGEITGRVVTPEGAPAAGVPVMVWAGWEPGFEHAETDDRGRFRFPLPNDQEALFWIFPQQYTQQVHFIDKRRGDLGTFTLENGIHIHGRVVDLEGKPLAGVWVNARPAESLNRVPKHLPISDHIFRSGLTDDQGRFELAPLPAANYIIAPSNDPTESLRGTRTPRPLPAAFEHRTFAITAASELDDIELRAVPGVKVKMRFVDSRGNPTQGYSEFFLEGQLPDQPSYFTKLFPDERGVAISHVPVGLTDARIDIPYSQLFIRHRAEPGAALKKNKEIILGTLDRDREVEVIRYQPAKLVVDIKAAGKNVPPVVKIEATYKNIEPASEYHGHRVTRGFHAQVAPDGQWEYELLPDEEFTFMATADGYLPYEVTRSLAEGERANIEVTLEKTPTR